MAAALPDTRKVGLTRGRQAVTASELGPGWAMLTPRTEVGAGESGTGGDGRCRLGASRQEHTAQMCLPLRPGTQGPCCPIPSAQSQAGDRGAGARSKTQTSCCCQRCRDQLGMSRQSTSRLPNHHPSELQGTGKAEAPAVGAAGSVWEPLGYCCICGPCQKEDGVQCHATTSSSKATWGGDEATGSLTQ